MSDFQLSVERLTDEPELHRFEASPDWWAKREAEDATWFCEVEEPFRFECNASRVREDLLLDGDWGGSVALECSRCAKRYSHALRDSFRLVLSPVTSLEAPDAIDPEGERGLAENGLCLGEDLETGWFRGPVVQLDELFGEAIALAMPIQPLCREDCPGICPHCGVDRSETQCDCVDEKIESPFAVLAGLKGKED